MIGAWPSTPFADAVLRLRGSGSPEVDIVSFHALPWSNGGSLRGTGIQDKYDRLFGEKFLASEMTYAGPVLDSFFRPSGPLELAQRLAAAAFGSDRTFFITCGTTLANQVALEALDRPGRRILVDRAAHYSLHVAANQAAAEIDYAPHVPAPWDSAHALLDVPGMLARLAGADRLGRPYDAVVLAGSSYDGLLYDMPPIIDACRAASSNTSTFLVDEAWSAINAFHPALRPLSALVAARQRLAASDHIRVLVTHSAHKSMSAARQGSYLHLVGDDELVESVRTGLYGRHSTSPSIPLLASLDLARAHAEADGERLLQRSIDLAERLRQAVDGDPDLKSVYTVVSPRLVGAALSSYVTGDPTKVLLDVSGLEMSGEQARRQLFADHRIYVARTIPTGILVNFHIGVDQVGADRLLGALRSMASRSDDRVPPEATCLPVGAVVERLIVAYPPGVPIVVPGEVWTAEHQRRLDALRGEGIDVYVHTVPTSRAGGGAATDTRRSQSP